MNFLIGYAMGFTIKSKCQELKLTNCYWDNSLSVEVFLGKSMGLIDCYCLSTEGRFRDLIPYLNILRGKINTCWTGQAIL